jgi:hypothetical protein
MGAVLVPSPTVCRPPQHPGAEILLAILEIEFLGDGDAVLQTTGAPFFSISTDFERGPNVTRTASASWHCAPPNRELIDGPKIREQVSTFGLAVWRGVVCASTEALAVNGDEVSSILGY